MEIQIKERSYSELEILRVTTLTSLLIACGCPDDQLNTVYASLAGHSIPSEPIEVAKQIRAAIQKVQKTPNNRILDSHPPVIIDLLCPKCNNQTLVAVFYVEETGEHQHTHYHCMFWSSTGTVPGDNRCGWHGWTVPSHKDK